MQKHGIIRLENVSKEYDLGEIKIHALSDINLSICNGDFISIMGPSGSGKTTLLDILSTLLRPSKGKVFIEENDTTEMTDEKLSLFRGKKIGTIFQNFNLQVKLTALENVMTPMWIHKVPKNKRIPLATKLLEQVGLGDRLNNKPNQLSGGQMQRVSIARSLAMNPGIIVADEPTGNLDSKSEKQVIDILMNLNKVQGKTIIMVTHEPELGKLAPKRILMRDGKIQEYFGFEKCPKWIKSNETIKESAKK
ncbi:MAG: ABC transporter ATP-binding protein [Candidatus Diapherotrites archaeon]|nr:ABC transporter ATP-binding protein [Candidatus Diapherotrites archaeon]